MRILYAVQRYGRDIVGGSEAACRMFTEHLVARGHDVSVVTSCAKSYVDWAGHYEPGTTSLNGVTVHRLAPVSPRRGEIFGPLDHWMHVGPHPVPGSCQQRWTKAMGPELEGYRHWLFENAHQFDVVIFMTYLYSTATRGLPVTAGRVPTVFQPTAHDEPPFRVPLMSSIFRQPDAFMYFTPEEREIVERTFRIETSGAVTGIGIDLVDAPRPDAFREHIGIGDRPYLLYAGRFDRMKGALELADFFRAYKMRNGGDLALVYVGEQVIPVEPHPDIFTIGFVDEEMKCNALAGAVALAQPSYFESFSIVLCESWVQRRPAIVQGRSPVLTGQARRSGGALPFVGYAEFEAAVDLLLQNPGLADELGASGRRYVEDRYRWDVVMDRVEETIETARARFAFRTASPAPRRQARATNA
jgi:glycosyltransferase involved in cell wall biosynthesis